MSKTRIVHTASQVITYYEMTKMQKFQKFLSKTLIKLACFLEPTPKTPSVKEKPKYIPKVRIKECPSCGTVKPVSDEFSYCKECLDTMWNDYKELK